MHLQASGLTTSQVHDKQQQFGLNDIPEVKESFLKKLQRWFVTPITFMLIAASVLSFATGKTFDGYFILILLVANSGISIWQENKADTAIKKLNEHLQTTVKVLRDGQWRHIDSKQLVPGDILEVKTGDIISADGKVLVVQHASINESALTGESLPKEKEEGDTVYSGSYVATGNLQIEVTTTGKNTYFGKTLFSIEKSREKSMLEKDIMQISKFLSILSIGAAILLTLIFLLQKAPLLDLLTLDLSLIIAGIPVTLPTVMTVIIAIGIVELAKKHVVVRRLSALEDLANVNLLLTDKTGTLTQNKILVQEIISYGKFSKEQALSYAYLLSHLDSDDPIDKAITQKVEAEHLPIRIYNALDIIPADSVRKRSTGVFQEQSKKLLVSLGAPQIVGSLCALSDTEKEAYAQDIETFAKKGYRTLAIAVKEDTTEEKTMHLVGLFALADTPRPDALHVMQFMKANNIDVVMVTGDNKAISQQVARELGIPGEKIVTKDELTKIGWQHISKEMYKTTQAFSEIFPEDKYHLVETAKKHFVVAVTGDGVNDLPAVKTAHVGFAVQNAVSVLKATADIVLLSNGIAVIRDAIIESRKIFARLYSYSLYRISESLRLIVTITVLGILYRMYPLTPLQLILAALFNDIPTISLAFDHVKIATRPAHVDVKKRFILSSLYGLTGIANSLIMFFLMTSLWHLPWGQIQTAYFMKLNISGLMLIFVAHTKERWWKFFPSKQVVWSILTTQCIATILALTGFLMPSHISLGLAVFVWIWSFIWMQIGEGVKVVSEKFTGK